MKFDSTKQNGFSLIELMIVVAIVGILARVAYPSYVEYVRRGARAEARSAILNMAQYQERNFSDRGAYVAVVSGTTPAAPWNSLNWSGSNYASRKYDVTVTTGTPPFTITATPANGHTDPSCANLTLTNEGTKGSSAGSAATCWK